MRLKRTIAVLMAIFLMAGPSWAAVCDLACSGASQRHVCQICSSAEHTSLAHSAAHMHCDPMESQDGMRSVRAGVAASPHCAHPLCEQSVSAVLPSKSFQPRLSQWDMMLPASVAVDAGALLIRTVDRAPPPRLNDSRRPLALPLRV